MRLSDILTVFFVLILVYLLVKNWQGANALLSTGINGVAKTAQTLQGR